MLYPSNKLNEEEKEIINTDASIKNILQVNDEWYYNDTTKVSNSHLKVLLEGGPEALENYYKYGSEDNPAFAFGRAFHMFILEPHLFTENYWILDDTEICKEIGGKRPSATKKYKEWLEQVSQDNLGKEVISFNDVNRLEEMKSKLYSIPQVVTLLKDTQREVVYNRSINGVDCKGKLDAVKPNHLIIDLKTTSKCPSPEQFSRDFRNYSYDQQMAFYSALADVPEACIIAIQKVKPYTVGVYMVSKESMQQGTQKYEYALELYKELFRGNLDIDKFYYQGSL
tara:strand:+ start:2627 stop:3475 length:849 start_codon:yes stop_codon:yes gene_type:complete